VAFGPRTITDGGCMRFRSALPSTRRPLSQWLSLRASLAAIALLCSSCTGIPQFSQQSVLTPDEQAGLGAVAVTELLGTSQLSQDQQQIAATTGIGQRLAAASGRNDVEWNFKVVQHKRPIAVALPDGSLFVTDSLLARCHNEAELAAVLAKEMGYMLAGVYPRETTTPDMGLEYLPLDIGRLTPADQSATRSEDIEAADSIGLSLLVRAGYDPSAAQTLWLATAPAVGPRRRGPQADVRRNTVAREQSFNRSLTQARSVYQSHTAKLGEGSTLAFTAAQPPVSNPPAPQPSPPQLAAGTNASLRKPAAAAAAEPARYRPTSAAHSQPGSNLAEFSSDGEFLLPAVAAEHRETENWSPVAETPPPFPTSGSDQSRAIEQASFESSETPPKSPGPLLP